MLAGNHCIDNHTDHEHAFQSLEVVVVVELIMNWPVIVLATGKYVTRLLAGGMQPTDHLLPTPQQL